MDVLGRFLQLGEHGQRVAGLRVDGAIHLQQQGAVALDDEGLLLFVGHARGPMDRGPWALNPKPVIIGRGGRGFNRKVAKDRIQFLAEPGRRA